MTHRTGQPTPEQARDYIESARVIWHQRFELAPGVVTPGVSDVAMLASAARLPDDLTGQTVLDIGTTNGGLAFEAERRGAARVVAVDIFDPDTYGFAAMRDLLGSRAEFVRASIYDLPQVLGGASFDHVVCWGVLYHLRHPLLALDQLRRLTRAVAYVETATCDYELAGDERDRAIARFYRRDELAGDASNWFAPTGRALLDWCASAGFDPVITRQWPDDEHPNRAMVRATPVADDPEWRRFSYELPVEVQVDLALAPSIPEDHPARRPVNAGPAGDGDRS